ncbi:MAG TPA: Maf family protein [Gammaproteobacteria bacterium]|nr:Maf family protein [Gammaproteobacteria bacterium]
MKKDFVYLASASPRRSELLRQIGVRFTVRAAAIPEEQLPRETPEAYVTRLATAKAESVWAVTVGDLRPVLGADTAVVLDGQVLGKPETEAEAAAMLERLSGRTHRVLTAVALRHAGGLETASSETEVRFRATTAAERLAYCRTGEPFDKAGGYGIQGHAAVFVEEIKGSYSGVVGLPLFETAGLLTRCGVDFWLAARAA